MAQPRTVSSTRRPIIVRFKADKSLMLLAHGVVLCIVLAQLRPSVTDVLRCIAEQPIPPFVSLFDTPSQNPAPFLRKSEPFH